MEMQFEIVKSSEAKGDQQHFWRIVAENGETLATSEMYLNKQSCRDAVDAVLDGSRTATVHEVEA